jgi:peptidyl-prolyl cis-trans isomerase B (cyclophilin B)
VELFGTDAPGTVDNFLTLARAGYFNGQEWPRVVPNFVIQGGDPRGDTSGGPGYAIRDEINRHLYGAGTLGMALSGPDTGGSQWFITHSPQPHLDGTYTVFGQVVGGMEVVHRVLPGDRILRIEEVK